ncbi:MAG: hypothetical protein ACE5LF_01340 [Alphaproteobacteria bacterium]
MTHALQAIRLEHFNIDSVLACLRYLVRAIEDGDREPDFDLLSTIVAYMAALSRNPASPQGGELPVCRAPAPMGFGDRKAKAG